MPQGHDVCPQFSLSKGIFVVIMLASAASTYRELSSLLPLCCCCKLLADAAATISQSSSAVGANALFIHGWSVIPAGEPSVEVTTVTQVCLDTHVC